jgi:cyanobactin maturation PatA/PatG family protease
MTNDQGLLILWSETTGDPRVVVAVLDGPVDRSHSALAGAYLETIAGAAPGAPRRGGAATRHGTAVASLIFGQHGPESPVWGMAPGCRGLIVPIFGDAEEERGGAIGSKTPEPFRPSCSQRELARGILLAVEHGAWIINLSAGQPVASSSADPILVNAVNRAVGRGILVVAAAGNDGCACAHIPAALRGVLAVGAMDAHGRPLASSNWGDAYRSAGLLAPGIGWGGALVGGGTAIVVGTSAATAVVSGAAALLMSLALRRGRRLEGMRTREILLDSADKCPDDSILCRRHLAGRLNLAEAGALLRTRDLRMSDEFPHTTLSEAPGLAIDATAELTRHAGPIPGPEPMSPALDRVAAVPAAAVVPSEGCSCASCQAKAAGQSSLVFALGQIGYDVISEARRDSIQHHMGGTNSNPLDPAQMLAYLRDQPWEATSILWLLKVDLTPIYGIAPAGPFAARAYELLREFLEDQERGQIELVSIPGRLDGHARLLNGQVVPVIVPEPRGIYSWTTDALVQAVVGAPPPADAPDEQHAVHRRRIQGVRGFLQRIYHELRNLGLTAEDRAMNYAATNAFEIERVFESAAREAMELDSIEVERSPICRPDSDCWDVKIHFFYPERQVQTVRKVYRFTVDVSDVVPVTVGPMRSWFAR